MPWAGRIRVEGGGRGVKERVGDRESKLLRGAIGLIEICKGKMRYQRERQRNLGEERIYERERGTRLGCISCPSCHQSRYVVY